MKIYTLSAAVTVSAYTKVEATSLEEAIKIAEERSVEFHVQTPYEEDVMSEWIVEEIDGEAMNITEG